MTQVDGRFEMLSRLYADDRPPSALVEMLSEFHRRKISYCYWKGSRRLQAVFAGEGDVDLLIARADQHRAQAVLLEQDFKLFPSVADREHPAVLTLLGYDEKSGRLVHAHLHFRLTIGNGLLKNHRIPWEEALLARAVFHPTLPIRTLDPTSDALLLVIRACLELRRLNPTALGAWQATTRKFALDRADLVARVDPSALRALAADLLGEELADVVTGALYSKRPLERQLAVRRQIRRHCAVYRSYGAVEAGVRTAGRTLLWIAGYVNKRFLHAPRPWNRRAPGGGCMVAIIGVDGSGKSTAVATIRTWLGSKIDVIPMYFGTGDGRPSLLLLPLKLIQPSILRIVRRKRKGGSSTEVREHVPGPLYSVLLMVWAAAVALDKRAKLAAACRGTNRGLVVLTDRYPQDQIIGFNDGPLLTRLAAAPRLLRQFESAVYGLARRLPPDLVIKLVVTPETAARREPQMYLAVIRERVAALQRLQFPGARVVCVDAERPLPEVIRSIKREIWQLI